jgi:L-rhamnose mutarotase-like protein
MKRYGLSALLRDEAEAIAAYDLAHQDIPAQVNEDGRRCGVLETCIFRRGRELFMYMLTTDSFDLDGYAECLSGPVTGDVVTELTTLFTPQSDSVRGLPWVEMKPVIVVAAERSAARR